MAFLREAEVDLAVREYLKTPLDLSELQSLNQAIGISVREMIRNGEDEFAGLENADASKRLHALVKHPILLQRPIVVCGKKAVIARPNGCGRC